MTLVRELAVWSQGYRFDSESRPITTEFSFEQDNSVCPNVWENRGTQENMQTPHIKTLDRPISELNPWPS